MQSQLRGIDQLRGELHQRMRHAVRHQRDVQDDLRVWVRCRLRRHRTSELLQSVHERWLLVHGLLRRASVYRLRSRSLFLPRRRERCRSSEALGTLRMWKRPPETSGFCFFARSLASSMNFS